MGDLVSDDTIQLALDGEEVYPSIEFDCPICGKHIIVERTEKGHYLHRSWMFHFTYEHGELARDYVPDSIGVWLYLFFYPDDGTSDELMKEWKEKVKDGVSES